MALAVVANGQISDASQLNQVVCILQQQVGAQEVRNYFCYGSSYVSSAVISISQSFLSSVTSPTGASLNTAIQTPLSVNTPVVNHLTATGMQLWTSSTAVNPNVGVAGAYTVQF